MRHILSAALVAVATPAFAASYAYVAVSDTHVLNPGQTATVSIYITETLGIGEPSLIDTENGLYAGEVRIDPVSSTAVTPTTVLAETDVQIDPAFDDVLFSVIELNPAYLDIIGVFDFTVDPLADGPKGTVAGDTRSIKLADVTFTAGTEGETVVQLISSPLGDNTVTLLGTPLDSNFASPGPTISFTVLPEPTTLGLLGGAAMLVGRRRRTATR